MAGVEKKKVALEAPPYRDAPVSRGIQSWSFVLLGEGFAVAAVVAVTGAVAADDLAEDVPRRIAVRSREVAAGTPSPGHGEGGGALRVPALAISLDKRIFIAVLHPIDASTC